MSSFIFVLACAVVGSLIGFAVDRRRIAAAAEAIRDARAAASGELAYRVPASDEAALVRFHERRIEALTAKLDLRGLVLLGDVVVHPAGQRPLAIMRSWVADRNTTAVYVLARFSVRAEASLFFESYARDGEYLTLIGATVPMLATPPFSRRQVFPPGAPFPEMLDRHRALTGDAELVPITSFEELTRALARNHELNVRWREAQPPDELLDADLRGLLGASYERHGKRLAERLAAPLPRATMRRGS